MSIVLALRGNMAREDEVTPERPGPPFLSALIKWERSTDQRRRDVARFRDSERDASLRSEPWSNLARHL